MSEVEKLRALLAEVVPLDVPCPGCFRTIDEERRGYGREGCVHTARRLKVDAALAGSVDGCVECEIESKAHALTRYERDEARAEVERLRDSVWRCEHSLKTMLGKWTKPAFDRGQYLPELRAQSEVIGSLLRGSPEPLFDPVKWRKEEVRKAYQRGAAAMREAAALCAEREETQLPLHVSNAIRAMPIPEDK